MSARLDPGRPTVPEVAPLVLALYHRPGGAVGCCLHTTLDEPNIDDGHVDYCIEEAVRAGHKDCEELARILRRMSKTQRRKLGALPGKYTP